MTNIVENTLMNKNQIIANEIMLLDAMKDNDVRKLDELLHPGLHFNIPSGQTITKAKDLETYRSENMKIGEILSKEQEINLIEDNAIVTGTIEMKGKYYDHILDGKYRFIRVWKLFDNKWKVIAGSSTQI